MAHYAMYALIIFAAFIYRTSADFSALIANISMKISQYNK